MSEFYYESELTEIFNLLKDTQLGVYGVDHDMIIPVDLHHKVNSIKSSLDNYEKGNPLLDYKAYLLFESLFVFDLIERYDGFIVEGVPIPLFMLKRGSKELQSYWHEDNPLVVIRKQEYYQHIKGDANHIASIDGELAELEHFFKHLKEVYDLDVIDSQLQRIGLSYDTLVDHILVDDWRSHPNVEQWNKMYSDEDWLHHGVL